MTADEPSAKRVIYLYSLCLQQNIIQLIARYTSQNKNIKP